MYKKRNSTLFHFVFLILITNFCWSQNIAPTLTATGSQLYCPGSQINIVTDFNIVDPDDTEIEALFVQISTGYVQGQDTLVLLGVHPNIVTSWNAIEGKLTLKGIGSASVSYIDLIAGIKDVVFQSTSNQSTDKSFSITIGDANYLPKTDHYYEYVPDYGITWTAAKAAAENRTYFGLKGYLVTITSAEEAQLSGEQAAGAGWIGATDLETEGVWKWVTGPEAGTVFWNGTANGSTPNYANWNYNEPNNVNGGEDYAHITDPSIGIKGAWNDLRVGGDPPGYYHPKGYVVEYGGTPGDPVLNISASSSIFTASIVNTTPAARCGSGTVNLEATASQGDVLWFATSTSSTPIFNGSVFTTPSLSASTTYYALASINGCVNGERIPVTATIYQLPIIQSSIVFKNCDEDGVADGFTNFNLEEANDVITNNNTTGLAIAYYISQSDADSGVNSISPIFNNQNASIVYARVENSNGCYEISTVNLQVSTTTFAQGYLQELDTCDDDIIDGFHVFDLNQASASFISEFPSGQNLSVHYFRNLSDAQLEQNEIITLDNYTNETSFSQILYVRVESDDNGECFGLGPHLLLTVHPKPEFEIGQTEVYCSDNSPISLFTYNSKDNYTYEWRDVNGIVVSNSSEATVTTEGVYTVMAISGSGCESFPISFEVFDSAIATIDIDDITIVELTDNNSITINNDNNNLGIGDYEFSLDDISGPYNDEPFFDRVGAGSHILYVKDKNKCGIAEIEIFILGFPKFFTPNNDGTNDTWQIKGLGTDFTNASKVSVYNRYGKLVKQLNAKSGTWDGTFNGEQLPDSDYWFVAELVEVTGSVKTYRGHFSLVR